MFRWFYTVVFIKIITLLYIFYLTCIIYFSFSKALFEKC